MIIEVENKTKKSISLKFIPKMEKVVSDKLSFGKNFKANVFFLPSGKMKKLNWENRHIDTTTDVLSFPLYSKKPYKPDAEGMVILGDIMIDPVFALKKAKEASMAEEEEMIFLMVHGLLHLDGFDHDTDKKESIMNKMTERIIEKIHNDK